MRNVVSPRGPLSPKVYWRRRLLMLAVVVGVVLLVGQLFGGGADTAPVAERADPEATARPRQQTPTVTASPDHRPRRDSATRRSTERDRSARGVRKADRRDREAAQSPALSGAAGPLATPAGACKASEVVIAPDVEDTDAFGVVPLRLGVSTSGAKACTFAFGPDTVAVQITSGDDLIWQSLHCGRVLEEQSVVARPGWLSYITVQWPGRRGEEGCGDGNEFAQPGYYWAEAAAIGGEPERSQFELETPPKPTKEPTEAPSKKGTTEPSEQSEPDRQGQQREPDRQGQQSEPGRQDAQDDASETDGENQPESKPTATATGDAEPGQT